MFQVTGVSGLTVLLQFTLADNLSQVHHISRSIFGSPMQESVMSRDHGFQVLQHVDLITHLFCLWKDAFLSEYLPLLNSGELFTVATG